MGFRIILFVWDFLLDVLALIKMSEDEKDIQILLLQQQLRIAERHQKQAPSLPRWQKTLLAALANKLKKTSDNAKQSLAATIRLFKPVLLQRIEQLIICREIPVLQSELGC